MEFRCWCCWEYNNEDSDPLIRACTGCLDEDLQMIHVSCLERYLNGLCDTVEYRCTRCLDYYPVELQWSRWKGAKRSAIMILPSIAIFSLVAVFIVIILMNDSSDMLKSPVLDYFHWQVSLNLWALCMLLVLISLASIFLRKLYMNIPPVPTIKCNKTLIYY